MVSDKSIPQSTLIITRITARALATSVRQSQLTDSRLPSFFLTALDIRRHPSPPHQLNFTPSRLFAEASPDLHSELKIEGTTSYIESNKAFLNWTASAVRWRRSLVTLRQQDRIGARGKRDVHLRKDIGEFCLDLLRKITFRGLHWPFQHHHAGLIVRCDHGASAIEEIEDVACVLYIKSMFDPYLDELEAQVAWQLHKCDYFVKRLSALQARIHKEKPLDVGDPRALPQRKPTPQLNHKAVYATPPYLTVSYRDGRVPVYCLEELLGSEKTGELLRGTVFEDARCVAIKAEKRTTNAQMALLRVQNFLKGEFLEGHGSSTNTGVGEQNQDLT